MKITQQWKSTIRVDFRCRVVFTCVQFTFANKIQAMHERSLVSVKVEPCSTSRLSTFYLASILFTWLKFACVKVRSQKRVSENQPLEIVERAYENKNRRRFIDRKRKLTGYKPHISLISKIWSLYIFLLVRQLRSSGATSGGSWVTLGSLSPLRWCVSGMGCAAHCHYTSSTLYCTDFFRIFWRLWFYILRGHVSFLCLVGFNTELDYS